MGNYAAAKAEVKTYLIARVPLILVRSPERERVERMLRELVSELRAEIYYYTETRQVCALGSGAQQDADGDPLLYAREFYRRHRGGIFALGEVSRAGEENSYTRELLDILYLCAEQAGTLILVTADPVWPRVAQLGMTAVLDLPDQVERTAQIRRFRDRYQSRFPIRWEEEDILRAAALLRGFSEMQVENILSATLVAHGGLDRAQLHTLTRQKSRLYGSVDSIQPVTVSDSLQFSGLQRLRRWLAEKRQIFFLPDEVLAQRDLEPPSGILLAGIPGCGKSYSARMVAKTWELPLFRFDIGSVYDKWVGESERRMGEALAFLDNVAPCVVWIDEIEKALAVSSQGNDTGKRVLGQFLFWLQESTSRVFLVATANDITQLPPELFRKGRFSQVFFVDLPGPEERAEAITQYAGRCLRRTLSPHALEELVALSDGCSYADIEYVIKEGAQAALLQGEAAAGQDLLVRLFRQTIPFARTNPDTVEALRAWGKDRAEAASEPSQPKGGSYHE